MLELVTKPESISCLLVGDPKFIFFLICLKVCNKTNKIKLQQLFVSLVSSVEIALVVMSVIVGAGVLSLGLVASLRIYKAVSSTRSLILDEEFFL